MPSGSSSGSCGRLFSRLDFILSESNSFEVLNDRRGGVGSLLYSLVTPDKLRLPFFFNLPRRPFRGCETPSLSCDWDFGEAAKLSSSSGKSSSTTVFRSRSFVNGDDFADATGEAFCFPLTELLVPFATGVALFEVDFCRLGGGSSSSEVAMTEAEMCFRFRFGSSTDRMGMEGKSESRDERLWAGAFDSVVAIVDVDAREAGPEIVAVRYK